MPAVLLAAGLGAAPFAWAHALLHQSGPAQAVVVRLQFQGSGDQPWAEPYEIYAPGSEQAYQRGQVNADGEIVFRPHAPGAWRIRVATEDGHGSDIRIDVDAAGQAQLQAAAAAPWQRVLTGLSWVFGLFGVLVLWRQRRAANAAPTDPT